MRFRFIDKFMKSEKELVADQCHCTDESIGFFVSI